MKYIIMLSIVVGLAAADFITGFLKALVKNDVSSKTMRIGGIHKLAEIMIMGVACGLEVGLDMLGRYYSADVGGSDTAQKLASVSGMIAALLFFVYILVMELTSILENYVEINPQARWALWIVKKLRIFTLKEEEKSNVQTKTGKARKR